MGMVLGGVVGGLIGYGVYRFIGCASGACPITSNPYVSVIVFAMLGASMASGK